MRSIDHFKKFGFCETGLTGVKNSTIKNGVNRRESSKLYYVSQYWEELCSLPVQVCMCISIYANWMLTMKLYCHNSLLEAICIYIWHHSSMAYKMFYKLRINLMDDSAKWMRDDNS